MKTEFELGIYDGQTKDAVIKIIGERPTMKPKAIVIIEKSKSLLIKDKDLERLAVNILKALKSKRLKL